MDTSKEKLALKLSAAAYLGMAVFGIAFAMLARSDVIMLSGFFSLISFAVGLLSLKVADLVQQPGDERFHFGYAFFEPLLNTIKGLFVAAVCAFALASAVDSFLHGGRPLNAGWGLLYAGVAAVGCFAIALIQRAWAKRTHSPLLEVDVKNWMLDGFVNSGVGVAFLIAVGLSGSRWSDAVPYVDPVVVVALVLVLIWVPLKTVKDNVQELLQMAPPAEIQQEVRARFDRSVEGLALEKTYVRMVRIGRYFYVMTQLIVPSSFRLNRVKELDDIRRRIADGLKDIHPKLVVDSIFTEDEEWTK